MFIIKNKPLPVSKVEGGTVEGKKKKNKTKPKKRTSVYHSLLPWASLITTNIINSGNLKIEINLSSYSYLQTLIYTCILY